MKPFFLLKWKWYFFLDDWCNTKSEVVPTGKDGYMLFKASSVWRRIANHTGSET
jgi:hypothetical protein